MSTTPKQEAETRYATSTNKEPLTMERRELSGPGWTPRQAALYDVLEQVAEVFGPFDTGTGPDGIHYMPAADNPFAADGIRCANCAFYEGGGGCELLADDQRVKPDAVCKFWVIPGDQVAGGDAPAVPAADAMNAEDAGYGMTDEARALVTAPPFTGPALVALIGPPGAGKTSWLRSELPDAERVSLEAIRTSPDADRGQVITDAILRTFTLLRAGKLVAFDSTAIDPGFRRRLRGIGRVLGLPVHAVVFRTPVEKLLAAQEDREHPVPDARVVELYERFQEQYARIPGEGWASVTTISREGTQERAREEFAELRARLAGEARDMRASVTEVRAMPEEDGGFTIEGHAAVFDSNSYPLPDGRGGTFVEQVKRGAFRRALQAPEGPTAFLVNHDANLLLASTHSNPPTLELWEDPKGLRFRARVAPTSYAEDLRLLMERGDVAGMSFGFTVESDRWWQDGEGRTRRDIQRIGRLTDVSVVTASPAYPEPASEITSREAAEPHEEATASVTATGGLPAAASASTRRRRLDLIERTSARNPIRKDA